MKPTYSIYLAGEFVTTDKELPVVNPYNNEAWAKTYLADRAQVEQAIVAGLAVQRELAELPTYARAEALFHIANRIKERKEEFARALTMETGKPLFYARAEVDRAILTFTEGAEEAKRIYGEWLALDRHPSGVNHEAVVRRFPVGLVAAIAPFNFPLNLVAHKLAPALATGCPIVLKPASKTPISALLLAELIAEVTVEGQLSVAHASATPPYPPLERGGSQTPPSRKPLLPKGAVSILPLDREIGDMLVTDERFKLLTFTGSPQVGWDMKARAGKKKVVLELGGNAGLIVTPSANLEKHIKKIVAGSFGQSGQSCIHTQRIFAHQSRSAELVEKLVAGAKELVYGDPLDETTMFSSMIDAANAERIDAWVKEAVASGTKVLYGGQRIADAGYSPTILTNTRKEMKVCSREVFAPVVVVEEYADFKDAVARINDSDFGLQCGVLTNDLSEAHYAFANLEVGGVIINNVPNFRADHMPYGGVKDSGLGREGVRYAIEDMTERRVMVVNKD